MKTVPIILFVIAFGGVLASGFLFSKITGKLKENDIKITELRTENEKLEKDIRAEEIKAKKYRNASNTLEAEKLAIQANADRVLENLNVLTKRNDGLREQLEEANATNKELVAKAKLLNDQILNNTVNESNQSVGEVAELKQKITNLEAQAQRYQSEIASLQEELEKRNVPQLDAEQNGLIANAITTKVLSIDVEKSLIVISLGSNNAMQTGTTLTLRQMGFPLADIKVAQVGPDYSVARILPGINRIGDVFAGDTLSVTVLVTDKVAANL